MSKGSGVPFFHSESTTCWCTSKRTNGLLVPNCEQKAEALS
jgi:hypothetical protein